MSECKTKISIWARQLHKTEANKGLYSGHDHELTGGGGWGVTEIVNLIISKLEIGIGHRGLK